MTPDSNTSLKKELRHYLKLHRTNVIKIPQELINEISLFLSITAIIGFQKDDYEYMKLILKDLKELK